MLGNVMNRNRLNKMASTFWALWWLAEQILHAVDSVSQDSYLWNIIEHAAN